MRRNLETHTKIQQFIRAVPSNIWDRLCNIYNENNNQIK